jgi:hypothetical protein
VLVMNVADASYLITNVRSKMKQIITIFRAEGAQAMRLVGLCRRTPKAQLAGLREALRQDARVQPRLSAYIEYLDGWSMGDDFARIIGPVTVKRGMRNGELFALRVTKDTLDHFRVQTRRKNQFREQALLAQHVASLAEGSCACDGPVALAIFREVIDTCGTGPSSPYQATN